MEKHLKYDLRNFRLHKIKLALFCFLAFVSFYNLFLLSNIMCLLYLVCFVRVWTKQVIPVRNDFWISRRTAAAAAGSFFDKLADLGMQSCWKKASSKSFPVNLEDFWILLKLFNKDSILDFFLAIFRSFLEQPF